MGLGQGWRVVAQSENVLQVLQVFKDESNFSICLLGLICSS